MESTSLRSTLRHLCHFLAYVARRFPLLYVVIALTVVVLVFEYLATSLMLPLSSSATDTPVIRFWQDVASFLGVPATKRTWLWLFLAVMAVRLMLGYSQILLGNSLGKSIHRHLSGKIFRHIVSHEPLGTVYMRSVGYYITLAGDDTFRCGTIVSNVLQCAVGFSTAIVATVVLYQFSPPMFFAVLAFLALCGVASLVLLRHLLRLNVTSNALSRELGTYFIEALNSLRSIRSLHGQRFVQSNYGDQIARYVKMLLAIEAVRQGAKSFPAIALLLVAAMVLRPGAGIDFDEGLFFASTVIIIRIFAALGQFISAATPLLTDIRAIRDIRTLTDTTDPLGEDDHYAPPDTVRSVAIRDIHFGYDSQSTVLNGVSFRFDHGKTYAIVGPSGSGKSTLADILLGLVKPQSGQVCVNDRVQAINSLHGRLMLVEQQPKIFSATLRDNLLFGFEANDEQLWLALRMVDLEAQVRSMPNGLDTRLTYLGENLSGGQRQRIGIARALVRKPDVLLLDEATSALDPTTRAKVVANVRQHMKEGIIVFITHDVAIAELADHVLAVTPPDHSAPSLAEAIS